MRLFRCRCGSRLFFENDACVSCGASLGFRSPEGNLEPIDPIDDRIWRASADGLTFARCGNHPLVGCNWLVEDHDDSQFCRACRLNELIPNLEDPVALSRWAEFERAKRRLVAELDALRLPVIPRTVDPERGVSFSVMEDQPGQHVMTGHADGRITLNAAEADPVLRERTRLAMAERYRTLLGHFRHEVGHYYWDLLVSDTPWFIPFRQRFGDERLDYQGALQQHYANPLVQYADSFITSYAAAHPWEDWAETWAHYLHIADTLETAGTFGMVASTSLLYLDFDRAIDDWAGLTVALNELNRSMGLPDVYPFPISPIVRDKLRLVHDVVRDAGTRWRTLAGGPAASTS